MKRIWICLLTICLLGFVLAGCSASGRIEPNGMYGNVSTTRDGRVNGTNDGLYGSDDLPRSNTSGRTYDGASSQTGTRSQASGGAASRAGTPVQRGTGMAGGR